MSWRPRERVLTAFAHENAGRVPIDFGGAEFTSIIVRAYDKLKAYFGMDHETKMMSRLHSVVHPHEDILKLFGVDTRIVFPGNYEGGHQVDVDWKRTVGTDDCHFLHVDGVFFGEDLGTQDGCIFDSDSIYSQILKPRHRRMVEAVKSMGDIKLCYHCCKLAYDFIDNLIDIGVDALNPFQVTARNMEPERLKADFGDRIAFWGAINTQTVLPFATPDEVRVEVHRIIDILGRDGGYILNAVHNIQPEVPPENIIAMFKAAQNHPFKKAA